VNDLLDLAKDENNEFKPFNDFFSLGDSIQQSFSPLEFLAKSKSIQTLTEISP